ncbi:SMI1/KNR4 family protein [bacterium]|nr:SMI1/KNR4 family protein [bacterium]
MPPGDYEQENHPPVSDDQISAAEARLGITLPASIKKLWKIQDGGPTKYRDYVIPDNSFQNLRSFRSMKEEGSDIDFGSSEDDWQGYLGDSSKIIIVARHGFSEFLCLDYRKSGPQGEPEVVLFDTAGEPKEIYRAPSFHDFVNRLSAGKVSRG